MAGIGQLEIEVHPGAALTLVCLAGELDVAAAPPLREALNKVLDNGTRHVVIDVEKLSFIDVAGLIVLEEASRALLAVGGHLALSSPSRAVIRLLELAKSSVRNAADWSS